MFTILLSILLLFISISIRDIFSSSNVTLMIYFIILYAPYVVLRCNIYNDQLGFAVETLSGYVNGYIAPYQGEWTTLGHAFFAAIFGKILGLDLFNLIRYLEAVFVLIPFIIYSSLSIKWIRKNVHWNTILIVISALMCFPAFALDPLVYSRGRFGLLLGTILFLCMFNYIQKIKINNSIITTIVFVASSISYPLQPLVMIFSMTVFTFLLIILKKYKQSAENKPLPSKILLFFAIWSFIQVFYGEGVWIMLHEIILHTLRQEYLTALEFHSLNYTGDALIYITLRIVMMSVWWLASAFTALLLAIKARIESSKFGIFSLSILIVLGLLGVIYGISYHEPGIRFYRTLVAIMPFAVLNFVNDREITTHLLSKIFFLLLVIIIPTFMVLSPITKWGWMFIGYPTAHDIELANYIAYNGISSLKGYIYAPGSHQLLSFMFKINALSSNGVGIWVKGADIEFNLDEAVSSKYTATFYRIYILPRWTGKNVNVMLTEIYNFSSLNNLIYSNSDLHLLVENPYFS
ncbi:MAG: hypothetical protein QXD95_08955 [Nitrososphaeria archaeon]